METVQLHYGLPVVDGCAWAFSENMIYDAWAKYVEANPGRFGMDFLMRCASLPPQVEEALAVVRGPEGRMTRDVVRLVQKHSERIEFRKRGDVCPHDCVCPGAFEPRALDTLPEPTRAALWRLGLDMGITLSKQVYCAKLRA